MADLAKKFEITAAAVCYAVRRGENLAKDHGYRLRVWVVWIFKHPIFTGMRNFDEPHQMLLNQIIMKNNRGK